MVLSQSLWILNFSLEETVCSFIYFSFADYINNDSMQEYCNFILPNACCYTGFNGIFYMINSLGKKYLFLFSSEILMNYIKRFSV